MLAIVSVVCYNMVKSGGVSAFLSAYAVENSVISKRRMFMMTRNIRKIVSIICAVAILLSISVVSFTGSSSAKVDVQGDLTKPTLSEEVNLTFQGENGYGIPLGRSTNNVTYLNDYAKVRISTGWIFFGKDGSVGRTTVKHDASGAAAALADLYKVTTGNTYHISFKYKILAGAIVASRTFTVGVSANPTAGPATSDNTVLSGLKTTGLSVQWKVNGVTQTDTLSVDTDWQTATVEFTSVADGYFGINNLGSGSGVEQYFAIDDVVISKVIGSYGIDRISYDMTGVTVNTNATGTPNGDFVVNGTSTASIVKLDDAHGDVLQVGNRGTFADSGVFVKGKKYYVSFDGRSTSGAAQAMSLWLANLKSSVNGKITYGSQDGNNRYQFTDSSPFKFYIDGKEVGFANFKVGTEWQHFDIIIDLTDSDVLASIASHSSNKKGDALLDTAKYFYFGVKDSQYDNFQIIGIDPNATPGSAFVEEVVDGKSKFTVLAAGSKYTLTTPANTNDDRGFKCWVDADGKEIADPNNYIPSKGYNKVRATWTATFVRVTFVDGSTTSAPTRVGVGTKLLPPEKRPDISLFFQNWVDADGKVYTEVPGEDITLYAKYNGTILTFDKLYAPVGGDGTNGCGSLVVDPDNAQNNVFKFEAGTSTTSMIALPDGDYEGAQKFKLKTNTTYTYSIKYKVGAGSKGGSFQIVRGNGIYKNDSLERTDIPEVPGVKVPASETATEWKSVTGTFTIGDSHYLERVYWYYQNNLMLKASGECDIYFDDIVIAEVLSEAPEGTHAINFKTNGPELASLYGFTGEAIKVPTGITNGTNRFVGWYTDKKLSVPFTATEFGNEDITLYAKWEVAPFVMDLENYDNSGPASRCHLEVDDKGNHYFNWNSDFKPTQSATTMYSQQVNGNGLYCTLVPGVEYKVTFDYKLLQGGFTIGVVYNNAGNGWADRKVGVKALTLDKVDEKNWYTASYTFTADCPANLNYLSFGVAGTGNCYFDNIVVESSFSMVNHYGSTIIMFNSTDGEFVQPISGDPGEVIGTLPTPTRAGYMFEGWYTDAEYKNKFTEKTFGKEGLTLYANWILGKFNESFEDYPKTITLAGGYKLYNETNFKTDFDKKNVQSGGTSIFRNSTTVGDKAFTLCREEALSLTIGKQYTVSFYVKPTNVTMAEGTISLISMDKNIGGINSPSKKEVITNVGDLKLGEWQKVSYTFTASDKYVGISTSTGNDLYLDNFTVTLKGYTGTTTGDNSVNPMLIVMMIILAAGALTVTGKKGFEK